MSWGAVDDRFHSHRKVLRLRREQPDTYAAAVALWALSLSWAAGQERESLTGHVPDYVPVMFGLPETADAAAALVRAGLWEQVDDPPGWTFHDWHNWNGIDGKEYRSKEQARQRQAAHRLRRCQGGTHDRHCPTTDLDGNPWTCPKRQKRGPGNAGSRDPGSGRVGTGRDGSGKPNPAVTRTTTATTTDDLDPWGNAAGAP